MTLTYTTIADARLLALDPVAQGFGYVVLESPSLLLVDWGVKYCNRDKDECCGIALGGLLARYEPTAIVIEDVAETRALRKMSLGAFTEGIVDLLDGEGIPLFSYSRTEVRTVFGGVGALTKDQIAEVLTERFPELKSRAPKKRKAWEGEKSSMSIFDALSFALTHLASRPRQQKAAWQR